MFASGTRTNSTRNRKTPYAIRKSPDGAQRGRLVLRDLPRLVAAEAVEVAVVRRGQDVELLAAVGAVRVRAGLG